ncbi:MAG: hypothetical protein RL222_1741 [Bacteroidota bacterium]|jgi:glycine/D-amino acid oxidase-like deaminating enzyme
MMEEEIEYLIVGQGIAGTMLSHFLLRQNKKIKVIDLFHPNSSSNIAAGVVNPVTGRRMAKSWMIDELLPFAKQAYRELEKELNVSFLFEQPIYRIFSSEDDKKIWDKKKQDAEYFEYLGDWLPQTDDHIESPYGIGIIKNAMWMDVPVLIRAFREKLLQENLLLEDAFDYERLEMEENGFRYGHLRAKYLVFCEGYKAIYNPFFSSIPFTTAKGEHLVVQSEQLSTGRIYNRNTYILPKSPGRYTLGSTFVWDDLSETVSEESRKELLAKWHKMTSADAIIVEEKAGIRPTMKDRRPVVGRHTKWPHMFILNGMGTKGVSLSPYFSWQLIQYIQSGNPLPEEVNPDRFV